MLSEVFYSDHNNCDKCFPLVVITCCFSTHESNGHFPEMMLGRNIPLPVDPTIDKGELNDGRILHNYAQDQDNPREWYRKVTDPRRKAKEKLQLPCHRRGRGGGAYNKANIVGRHTIQRHMGLSPTLQLKWTGPFITTNKLSDATYRIKNSEQGKCFSTTIVSNHIQVRSHSKWL